MPAVNPYLHFSGNCEEVFNFYKSVFGGEFLTFMRFKDSPPEYRGPEAEWEWVMHVALPVGDKTVLMGSDTPSHMGQLTVGNNFTVALHPGSEEEARRLFDGLSAGGKVTMPLMQQFWGSWFGMFDDKFGVGWMVNYDPKNPM
ncbi:MAG TPA: VOC family protein [Puia sp.]